MPIACCLLVSALVIMPPGTTSEAGRPSGTAACYQVSFAEPSPDFGPVGLTVPPEAAFGAFVPPCDVSIDGEVFILPSGEEVQLVLPPVAGYVSYAARKPNGGLSITWWRAWYESVTAYLGPDPMRPDVLTGWLQPASDYPEKRFAPRVWLLPVPCKPEPNPGMQRTRCARR
jgi:hypothetical protein